MWDKLDLEIPFHQFHVNEFNSSRPDERAGRVDFRLYDFKASASVLYTDGKAVYDDEKNRSWDSISSAISNVAVGFFPEGNGFNSWPHIRVKASPSKILQGHNVFGSENIRAGCMQMITNIRMSFPKIFEHLDIENSKVCFVDTTYSARIESSYFRSQVFRLIESTASSRTKISKYEGYLLLGAGSDRKSQKVYEKSQELLHDYKLAKKSGEREKQAILGDKKLQDFALDLMRFEGTVGRRELERLGIPTDLKGFLKFHDWHQKAYKEPICRYLWRLNFEPIFEQLGGQTMKNTDDEAIRTKVYSKLTKVSDTGKVNKKMANAVWATYRAIKTEGYKKISSEDNSAFFNHVSKLVKDVGLSRAFLKSLDPLKPNENVVSIVSLINIDFSKQRPDWYEEPESGFEDTRRHLRLVG